MRNFLLAVVLLMTFQAHGQQVQNNTFQSVSVEEFAECIDGKRVVVVDVRTPGEVAQGMIPDAVNIVWNAKNPTQFISDFEKIKIGKRHTVAVYCRSGNRSKAASKLLAEKGYRVVELNPGINGWRRSGKEVVKP